LLQLGILLYKNIIGRFKDKLNHPVDSIEEAKAFKKVADEGNAVIINLKDVV